jgi:2-hydroxychromene-2-carboxylate isomerase
LKKNTDECINLGAFGAPVYVVEKDGNKEWFYGSDRWEQLAYLLG